MSLKDLKAAIIEQNWDSVRLAYENMTGDTIATPPKKRGRPRKEATPVEDSEWERITSKPEYQNQISKKNGFTIAEDNIKRDSRPKFIKNLFADSGSGRKEVMTPEEQALLDSLNASRVKRPDPTIEVACNRCGKKERVRGALAQNKSYKCENCIGR